jgi:HlyD family secretion protein
LGKENAVIFLVLLLAATLPLTACGPAAEAAHQPEQTELAQAAPPPAAEAPAAPVQVAPVETGDIAVIYPYTGDIQAANSVNVMPVTAGRVESVLVKVGDELKAGDPIAIVESKIYAAQLRQAKAGLELAELGLTKMEEGARPEQIAAAQAAVQFARNALNDLTNVSDEERTAAVAALAQTEAVLRLAQAEYDKIAWAGQVGMMPQALQLEQATIAYEAAKAAYELQTNPSDLQLAPLMAQLAQAELALALAKRPFTQTDYEMARAQIELAEAAVDMASIQMDEATIRAPFDGVVAELYITEGSMAAPQAPAALFVSKEVEVAFNVEESRISQVREGQNAALQVTAYPGQDFPAVVTSVAPIADKESRTFLVKATPIDEDHLLRSGMYADLSLLVEEKQATLLVPLAAVTEVDGQETVYVVNGVDSVEQRAVTTGLSDGERVEILSGLSAGQKVVIAGHAGLQDGTRVEVRN